MATESFFWAVELTKGNPESTWPADVADDECEEDATYTLEVERGCLGISAKQNDLNVVSVSTLVNDGESSTLTPIARLKVGGKEQCRIGLQFNSRVTFKLTSGNGPVHLMGLRETLYEDDEDLEDGEAFDDDEDSDELADIDPMPMFAAKKRSASSGAVPPGKKQSRAVSMPEDDDEDDSEYDDEDDSEDELNLVAGKKANGLTGKFAGKFAMAGDDDDDESDDEDFDVDDDEDDEDDEDDSDEEMDVPQLATKGKPQKGAQQQKKEGKPGQGKEQQKPQGKQQQQKPQAKEQKKSPAKEQQKKTPAKEQQKKTPAKEQKSPAKEQKSPAKEQKTPQKGKSDDAAAPLSIESVLQKLNSSPNLPKKAEKFANLLKNTYKLTDQTVINDLWTKVQKSRK